MYNRKTGQIIVEIPKNGSRSLVAAAEAAHGRKSFAGHGHKSIAEVLALMPAKLLERVGKIEAVAVIRDPADRFRSQLAQYMKIKRATLADALAACEEQSHIVFKPQKAFLDTGGANVGVKMYAMQEHLEAQRRVGHATMSTPCRINYGEYSIPHHIFYEERAEGATIHLMDDLVLYSALFPLTEVE